MAQGIKALRRIQLGKEITKGVAVAATTKWRGIGTIEDTRIKEMPDEDIGYLAPLDRQYESFKGAKLSFATVEATFEQVCHILEAGVKLVQTGAADGSGSGKIYDYVMPTTIANTLLTYTIEGGDNPAVEEMEYAFVEEFTLEGNGTEAVKLSAEWVGRQVSTSAFTGAATLPAVEEIIFAKGYLYIDDVGGTIGGTTQAETFMSFSLNVKTGIQAVPTADGNAYFSFSKVVKPEVTLEIKFEHNTIAVSEKAKWVAGTPRQIRLKFVGTSFTTAGTTYTNKTMILDVAGVYESFSAVEDDDGNDVITATLKGALDTTANLFAEFLIVNDLTSLP